MQKYGFEFVGRRQQHHPSTEEVFVNKWLTSQMLEYMGPRGHGSLYLGEMKFLLTLGKKLNSGVRHFPPHTLVLQTEDKPPLRIIDT